MKSAESIDSALTKLHATSYQFNITVNIIVTLSEFTLSGQSKGRVI
jgi:hypothetical protein